MKRQPVTIFMLKITGSLAILAVFVVCYSYFIEPFRLVTNRQEIRIDGWDREFDGFRAVLISDVHGGSRGGDAQSIARIVEAANVQNADAIFLLGDYVSTSPSGRNTKMPIDEIADLLGALRAKYGVFAVLGNHDGWLGDETVARELIRVRITVLNGAVSTIEKNGSRLRIIGLRDHLHIDKWETFSQDAKALLSDTEGSGNVIVLEHSPDVLEIITGDLSISKQTKLMFAGHTHGGQLWLPVLGYPIVPSSYGQKYAAGHIRDRGVDLFVTTGTGTSVLPFRFLVPPEIAVVTIRSS